MSIIDRAAEKAEIQLDRDVPVKGQRRCRDWSRLIGIARKLESEEAEREAKQRERMDSLTEENRQLLRRVYELEHEREKSQIRERMREMDLPERDQKQILGISAPTAESA